MTTTTNDDMTYAVHAADRYGVYLYREKQTFREALIIAAAEQAQRPGSAVFLTNEALTDEDHDGLTEDERETVEEALAHLRRPA